MRIAFQGMGGWATHLIFFDQKKDDFDKLVSVVAFDQKIADCVLK